MARYRSPRLPFTDAALTALFDSDRAAVQNFASSHIVTTVLV